MRFVSDSVPVASTMCERPIPPQVRVCEVPCPQDCIVTMWSEWGHCEPHVCKTDKGKMKPGEYEYDLRRDPSDFHAPEEKATCTLCADMYLSSFEYH